MSLLKIGCQLIIFGERNRTDFKGVLRDVADSGYAGIETGVSATIKGSELKSLLESHGLLLSGIHMGFNETANQIDEAIDYAKEAGTKYLMVSGVGDTNKGLVTYDEAAEVFNKAGEKCHKAGLVFCYHNHSWEFKKYDGVTALVRLYERTDPKYVYACVDTYWVQHGGESPVDFLEKYKDRVGYMHFKDMQNNTFCEIGQGIIDFPGVMKVLSQVKNLEWLTVEQDRTTRTPKASIMMSRMYIKEHLGL